MVPRQNRGRYSSKRIFVQRWCVSTNPLELFSSKTLARRGSPHPSPQWGGVTLSRSPVLTACSWVSRASSPPPTSVGFPLSRLRDCAWCRGTMLTKTSLVAHATRPTGSPTRTGSTRHKGQMSFMDKARMGEDGFPWQDLPASYGSGAHLPKRLGREHASPRNWQDLPRDGRRE